MEDDFAARKAALNHLATSEFAALATSTPCRLDLDAQGAVELLLALARASHHTDGIVQEFCREVGHQLQARYLTPGSALDCTLNVMWAHDDLGVSFHEVTPVPDVFRLAWREE